MFGKMQLEQNKLSPINEETESKNYLTNHQTQGHEVSKNKIKVEDLKGDFSVQLEE